MQRPDEAKRKAIMDTAAELVFHSAIVLSLYLLFAGHNQPGGGFVGGLVAGAAITVVYCFSLCAVANLVSKQVRAHRSLGRWLQRAAGVCLVAFGIRLTTG